MQIDDTATKHEQLFKNQIETSKRTHYFFINAKKLHKPKHTHTHTDKKSTSEQMTMWYAKMWRYCWEMRIRV